jgi:hypothetical protein
VYRKGDELGSVGVETFILLSGKSIYQLYVLAFNIAEIFKAPPNGTEKNRLLLFITGVPENSNFWDFLDVLRAQRAAMRPLRRPEAR